MRERHATPAPVVLDARVLGKTLAAPEPDDHPARREEHNVVGWCRTGHPAERLVERLHLRIVRPHHQHDLGDAELAQPVLGSRHDDAALTLALRVGIDRHVVDPAAVAVVTDHRGRDDCAIRAPDQDRGIGSAPRERDVRFVQDDENVAVVGFGA